MVYVEKFVASVKCNGKILRDKNYEVKMPFGSHYSIYLKNLESKRASVKISIDGEDILNGHSLIIEPNKPYELEGFIKDYVLTNKFKFIKKTQNISDHRGDRIDDGIIRIEYAFEETEWITITNNPTTIIHEHHYHNPTTIYRPNWDLPQWTVTCDQTYDSNINSATFRGDSSLGESVNYCCNIDDSAKSIDETIKDLSKPDEDEGITVKGEEVNEKMSYASIGKLGPAKVITLKLIGIEGNKVITKPITSKSKIVCETCGKKNKSSFKFCSECGAFIG